MKKQLFSMLMLFVVPFALLTGCKKEDKPKFTDTTFTLTVKEYVNEITNTGYFTSSGDPTTAGNYSMDVHFVGKDSLHCSQTLVVPTVGTITIISDCSLTTNTGTWYITEGTGAYANLKGDGLLIMSFPTETFPEDIEALYGKTWRIW
jgi:hypothetical protein